MKALLSKCAEQIEPLCWMSGCFARCAPNRFGHLNIDKGNGPAYTETIQRLWGMPLGDDRDKRFEKLFRVNGEVVIRPVAGETLVVPIRGALVDMDSVFVLNGVGAFIVRQMDGRTSLDDICDRVVEAFEVDRSDAERDVLDFADQLEGGGLIVSVH